MTPCAASAAPAAQCFFSCRCSRRRCSLTHAESSQIASLVWYGLIWSGLVSMDLAVPTHSALTLSPCLFMAILRPQPALAQVSLVCHLISACQQGRCGHHLSTPFVRLWTQRYIESGQQESELGLNVVGSQVVNKFQELVRLAQEAYINPFDLTRVRSLPCAVVADVLPLSQHAHCTSAPSQASNNVLGPHL